jgi:hypothetical protein
MLTRVNTFFPQGLQLWFKFLLLHEIAIADFVVISQNSWIILMVQVAY